MKEEKVAVVTGASGGIGSACCRALAEAGFQVGIHYRTGKEAAERLSNDLAGSFLLQADLGDPRAIDEMVERLRKEAGRVDVLVNNAGMSVNRDIHTMKMEEFDAQRLMARGAWYLTKRVLRLFMLRKNEGRIINISSVVGHTGNAGQIPYTMEKAALDAMTRSLARELAGRNILVNSVAPGFIETAMTAVLPVEIQDGLVKNIPLGRIGRPEEVAEVVAFLAAKGSYITGTVIHVNGGLYGG